MAVRANIRSVRRLSPGSQKRRNMSARQGHRALRMIVWANGWVILAIAVPGALQIAVLTLLARGYRVASSLALGCLGSRGSSEWKYSSISSIGFCRAIECKETATL